MNLDDPTLMINQASRMTKREHIAALVLQGIVANPGTTGFTDFSYSHAPEVAVKMADALLERLAKEDSRFEKWMMTLSIEWDLKGISYAYNNCGENWEVYFEQGISAREAIRKHLGNEADSEFKISQ